MRRVVHRAVREPVDGEAGTGEARRVAEPSRGDARSRRRRPGRARRASRRARRAAPARGGQGGHRHNAVEPSHERVVPAAAGSAASRRANEVRSDRRERRREGYPPEGPRPRSGLGRVARSRSDAPRLIDRITALPSIIGTIGDIGICTIARIVVIVLAASWSPTRQRLLSSASSPSCGEHRRRGRRHGEPDVPDDGEGPGARPGAEEERRSRRGARRRRRRATRRRGLAVGSRGPTKKRGGPRRRSDAARRGGALRRRSGRRGCRA